MSPKARLAYIAMHVLGFFMVTVLLAAVFGAALLTVWDGGVQ